MKNSRKIFNPGILTHLLYRRLQESGNEFRIPKFLVSLLLFLFWFLPAIPASAQTDSLVDQIYAVLILDSMTVTADQSVPDIKSMIAQTVHDTTFYRAFQRLRRVNYRFISELYFYKPDWIPHTFMRSLRVQHIRDGMRTNEIIEEHIDRNFIDRNGEYLYYTARMYDRIFFTDHPVRVPVGWDNDVSDRKRTGSRMEKYIQDLKLLLFSPGSDIDLPLMGDKTAIFSEAQKDKYDYSLKLDTTTFAQPVYQFRITADPNRPENETVIKELITVFDQKTRQVLSRSYRLAYKTILYAFDVSMDIQVRRYTEGYVPTRIVYKGWWDIPFKKPEWCRFVFQMEK